ncbi:MAG TPA: thiamine pyrophosphate-dependent dehydrogenase E1 component subunit alpha [Candidatus Paceibacterota bacterium]|nr:thiamine pyrophosphate-dependent dehydrogenase E1 component subunit alpha [Candidatus Paceibacterota bacterium]
MKTAYLDAFKKMVSIRAAEEEIAKYYLENKVMSFVHFYVGQEAVAVGVCDALSAEDRVMGNHRSHGHYLAKGGDLKRMVCELLGKAEGCCRGKGGSMHMIDKSVGFIGSTPILGSVVPLANGSAFEQRYSKRGGITAAFFGDGAFEEGVVYETLNLAALFKNPLLLVVENNLYSVNSKLRDRRSAEHEVERIVTGFGVRYMKADGLDYDDVHKKASELVKHIRSGKGPAVLECVTYRHMAHSAPIFDDAAGYREEDVLEKRLEKDSVKKVRNLLLSQGVSETELSKIEADARAHAVECVKYAAAAPLPDKKELFTDVYA